MSHCGQQLQTGSQSEGGNESLKNTKWSQLWRTVPVARIGAFHSNMPLPSQRSHAALTQRVAANLAWRKHGFKVNEGSHTATPQGERNSSTSQTKRHHRNTETTNKQNMETTNKQPNLCSEKRTEATEKNWNTLPSASNKLHLH